MAANEETTIEAEYDHEADAEPCGEGMCQCHCGHSHVCGCDCWRCLVCGQIEENCDCEDDY